MVLMEVEHEVWITFGVRRSIFLSGVFLNLTGNSYAHKKEVLMWYTSQSLDKSQVVHPAWWYLNRDPFLKGEVCSHTFRKIIAMGFEVHIWKTLFSLLLFWQLQVPDVHNTWLPLWLGALDLADCLSCRTHERLWHPCCQMLSPLRAPKTQKQVVLGLYDGNVL